MNEFETSEKGTLNTNEFHPAASSAFKYVKTNTSALIVEAMASCAIEGNRCAEICLETHNRIERGEPVSDRYLLGLAWFVRCLKEDFG